MTSFTCSWVVYLPSRPPLFVFFFNSTIPLIRLCSFQLSRYNLCRTAFWTITIRRLVSWAICCATQFIKLSLSFPSRRGFLSATSNNRWRASATRHSRHCWPGWVHSDARPVHEMWRGFHHLLLDMWPSQLSRGLRVSKTHRSGEIDRRHSTCASRQQARPAIPTESFSRRGKSTRDAVWLPFLRDISGTSVQCRWSFLHAGARDSTERRAKGENLKRFGDFSFLIFNFQALCNDSSSEKLRPSSHIKQSKWLRLRSIFALVFKRKRQMWMFRLKKKSADELNAWMRVNAKL